MKNFPRIFFLVIGIALGIGTVFLFQQIRVINQKPVCENLELELDMMKLRTVELKAQVAQQDSAIQIFRRILLTIPETGENP